MVSTKKLALAGGFRPEQLLHWADLLSRGIGFTRIAVPRRRKGMPRTVLRPAVGLDRFLKQLRVGLDGSLAFEPSIPVHGCVRGRGIVSNASRHLDRDMVLRVDLKDFFGAVSKESVEEAAMRAMLDQNAASMLGGVVTVGGSLPQGFSTSPLISNMVFDPTDRKLAQISARRKATYTRYVDDLVFSGDFSVVNDEFLDHVTQAVQDLGWTVNVRKTRFMRRGGPQYVTGLYVGDASGPHVPRIMKRTIRQQLHYANRFGHEDAQLRAGKAFSRSQLRGWVDFITHVEGSFPGNQDIAWLRGRTLEPHDDAWDDLLDDISFPDSW